MIPFYSENKKDMNVSGESRDPRPNPLEAMGITFGLFLIR